MEAYELFSFQLLFMKSKIRTAVFPWAMDSGSAKAWTMLCVDFCLLRRWAM